MQRKNLKAIFDTAYQKFHSNLRKENDPVCFAHRYSNPGDQEVAGFLAALLAYGNVRTILNSADRVLKPLGKHPSQYLMSHSSFELWRGFRHRFTTGDDIQILSHWLSAALESHGSLEKFFIASTHYKHLNLQLLLSDFVQRFTALPLPTELQRKYKERNRNLKYLLSDPLRGSACKRLNMFLRWMIRPADGVDLGIWKSIPPSALVLPVDTHLLQTLRLLRWTKSKSATWKVAIAATEKLRSIEPQDPIRYDFSLCHLSMSGESLRDYLRQDVR